MNTHTRRLVAKSLHKLNQNLFIIESLTPTSGLTCLEGGIWQSQCTDGADREEASPELFEEEEEGVVMEEANRSAKSRPSSHRVFFARGGREDWTVQSRDHLPVPLFPP